MPLRYALRLAVQSLRKDKWINILSMLTIFAGLFIISISFFVFYNIEAATRNLPEKFSMVVFLENNLPQMRIDEITGELRAKQQVSSVRFISKSDAFRELKSTLRDAQYVLEGLDENPLPDSIEVKLRKETVGNPTVKRLAEDIRRIKGVSEVDYGEKFLSALHNIRTGVKIGGTILAIILGTGIIFVCYSTVKILFYRRNEEIETFKLLGATKGFIRAPFIIEGAVIGTVGGLTSLASVFLLYYSIFLRLTVSVPLFNTMLFPAVWFLLLPFIGMFLGIFGAAFALGRLRY